MIGVFLALSDKVLNSNSILPRMERARRRTGDPRRRRDRRDLLGALRPYLRRYPTLPVSAFAGMAAAAAAALLDPGGVRRPVRRALARLSAARAGARSCSSGFRPASFYVVWLWALKNIAATRVTVFLALSPITAAAARGRAFLGEPLTADDDRGRRVRGAGIVGGEFGGVICWACCITLDFVMSWNNEKAWRLGRKSLRTPLYWSGTH